MTKNIVSKEDIMDKWYAYIDRSERDFARPLLRTSDNDYAEPNARLYCKLEIK